MMTVESIGDVTFVVLTDRLDSVGAAGLAQRFKDTVADKRAVVVDLADVDYIASLAIRFLLFGAKAVNANGGKFVILSPAEYVFDVLKAAGMDQLMPILFDRNEAIAAVKPPAT
jgi:stage II sporulation protein AA (anti-sigma F factor antagonist)